MLSRKNRQEYKQKYGDKKQRYSIHRVGLVTASVLVGLAFSGSLSNRIGEGQFLIQKMDGEFFILRYNRSV
ncbi:hypothetical protein GTO87_07600 [Ligilactobacillus saerimneri]|uniref:YSIRK-type signal peptide-containing protein n=1 Tax=Ligilactobacillus saerimneri TaxID=228229 RepID=A0A7H9EL92_9LACO|nr:hypothetical protein [Ligilactobacillus saerimneri]QLL78454.1 hypothetical protein GTO87_07600 [Ligilactobacillus saerimneri]